MSALNLSRRSLAALVAGGAITAVTVAPAAGATHGAERGPIERLIVEHDHIMTVERPAWAMETACSDEADAAVDAWSTRMLELERRIAETSAATMRELCAKADFFVEPNQQLWELHEVLPRIADDLRRLTAGGES